MAVALLRICIMSMSVVLFVSVLAAKADSVDPLDKDAWRKAGGPAIDGGPTKPLTPPFDDEEAKRIGERLAEFSRSVMEAEEKKKKDEAQPPPPPPTPRPNPFPGKPLTEEEKAFFEKVRKDNEARAKLEQEIYEGLKKMGTKPKSPDQEKIEPPLTEDELRELAREIANEQERWDAQRRREAEEERKRNPGGVFYNSKDPPPPPPPLPKGRAGNRTAKLIGKAMFDALYDSPVPVVGDNDGDGKTDILAGPKKNPVPPSGVTIEPPKLRSPPAVAGGDFNDDRGPDMVAGPKGQKKEEPDPRAVTPEDAAKEKRQSEGSVDPLDKEKWRAAGGPQKVNLGNRSAGRSYPFALEAVNRDCSSPQDFRFTPLNMAWMRLLQGDMVRGVAAGQAKSLPVQLDFSRVPVGRFRGQIEVTCETCGWFIFQSCYIDKQVLDVEVNVTPQ